LENKIDKKMKLKKAGVLELAHNTINNMPAIKIIARCNRHIINLIFHLSEAK